MADLQDKDYIRKVRQGSKEIIISLSENFIEENSIKVGDKIDLRTLSVISQEIQNNES